MKSPEEFAIELLSDGTSPAGNPMVLRLAPGTTIDVQVIADAIRDYHAAACREACGKGGPVSEERLAEIQADIGKWGGEGYGRVDGHRRDLLAALDHMTAAYLGVEGVLSDFIADHAHLAEDGRRRERADILEKIRDEAVMLKSSQRTAYGDGEYQQYEKRIEELEYLAAGVAARGPAPEPMPGDQARKRVKELEAALRRIVDLSPWGRAEVEPWKVIASEALKRTP